MTRLRAGVAVVSAICLGTAACGGTSSTFVTGSGGIVSRDIPVSSFSRLEVGRAFDVRVSVGATEAVTVHVDDNLVDELDVGVSGDTLHVDLKPGTSVSNATLKADVTVGALESIDASGASSISLADEIEAGKLSVTLSGASRLEGRIKTSDVSGASQLRYGGSPRFSRKEISGASSITGL